MKIKYLKTQTRLYTEHLQVDRKSNFYYSASKQLPKHKSIQSKPLQTNFAITLKNQYAFVLFHLKKSATTKNILTINIPQICIFYNRQPYEILYNDNGQIRSYRGKEYLPLKQMYNFFKIKWKQKGLNKLQPTVACFQKEQYFMMADTDLFITCRKFKNDPFFNKLSYIRNKINSVDDPVKVQYQPILDSQFTGEAMQSLLNHQNERELLQRYGEYKYLRYCNSKICLFLNYQHNIRVHKGIFYYLKSSKNQYFLVNVTNLQFSNLTKALKQHQKKQKIKQEIRNQCLIMSPQKQERYRPLEKSPNVKEIQNTMNQSWLRIAQSLRIKTNQQRIKQQQRNQAAFHILYPNIHENFEVLIKTTNFKRLKNEYLNFNPRKSLKKTNNNYIKQNSNRFVKQSLQKFKKAF